MNKMKTQEFWQEWNHKKWENKNFFMYLEDENQNRWPWYSQFLDPDIEQMLHKYQINTGKILDLGTCSGSQAINLAKLGFTVIGTDISKIALKKAENHLAQEQDKLQVEFLFDDILNTQLEANQFDLILDRGCFHSIYHFGKDKYINNVLKILKPKGMIFLKTMSIKEKRFSNYDIVDKIKIPVPHHFDPELLNNIFLDFFKIQEIKESFFYSSNLKSPAQAYLTILSKL